MSAVTLPEEHPHPRRTPSVGVLIAISSLAPLAMNIYLPSVSGMMAVFSSSAGEIQLTMTSFILAFATSQILFGPLSDQFGRRVVVLWGTAIFGVGTVLCLVAPTLEFLIGARMIQAFGGGAGLVLGRAIVRDLFDRERSASMIGYVTMGMALAPAAGPVLGGFLDGWFGWQGGFALMLVFGAFVLAFASFGLPETLKTKRKFSLRRVVGGYALLVRERGFWIYCATAVTIASLFFAYLGGAPFVAAKTFGMEPAEIGIYLAIVAIGYFAGNFATGRLAARVGIVRMITVGTGVAVFGTLLMLSIYLANAMTGPLFFLPMFLIGLGNGTALPSAMAGAVSVRPELAGSAAGLVGCVQIGLGGLVGTLVAALITAGVAGGGEGPVILVMSVLALAAMGCLAAVHIGASQERRAAAG